MLVGRQPGFEPGAGRFETYSRNQSEVLAVDNSPLKAEAEVRILLPEPIQRRLKGRPTVLETEDEGSSPSAGTKRLLDQGWVASGRDK